MHIMKKMHGFQNFIQNYACVFFLLPPFFSLIEMWKYPSNLQKTQASWDICPCACEVGTSGPGA